MKVGRIDQKFHQLIFIVLAVIGFSSCIPQKNLEYLSSAKEAETAYKLTSKPTLRIKPYDELYIKVSSLDDVAFNFFSTQGDNSRSGFSNELSVSLLSYTVSDSGYIYFPILGNIYVQNLTLDEARINLEKELAAYFNQPTVIMKFAYKKISVLGAVRNPGYYTYTKENMNVFEALSTAGDIIVHGNRKNVYLLRVVNDSIRKIPLNLQSDELLYSKYFFLQPDDIIYVKPRGSIKWDVISVPISLIFSTITTALLIINYF
jgi:polysaccharide export outer membrane protein